MTTEAAATALGRVMWTEDGHAIVVTLHSGGKWSATVDGGASPARAGGIELTYPDPLSGGPSAGTPGWAALASLAKAVGGTMEWLRAEGEDKEEVIY